MRKFLAALGCTAILGGALAFLTGTVGLVETHGNSMAPRITAGDLVVVRASTAYQVGDVVAYTSADLHQTVLHRVVAVDDNRYTFRGDNNDFDDPEHPAQSQLIGTELVHIPSGGVWLDRVTAPAALGVFAFCLLAGGAAVDVRRRSRHKQEGRAMAQQAAPPPSHRWVTGWPPWLRTAVAIAALTGVSGLLLGVVAWTRPTTTLQPPTGQTSRTMTFNYHAEVVPSPAYDGTQVTAPAPIFRKITNQVDFDYTYRGDPGKVVTTSAELSTPSGWTSTVPLGRPVTFDGTRYTGQVRLHLKRLEKHASKAADAIGIPAAQVELTVVTTVMTANGQVFAPRLNFTLTPTQLTLPGGTEALTVSDTTASPGGKVRADRSVGLAGRQLPVATLRTASVALTLTGLLMLCVHGLAFVRTDPNEAAVIKRRYAALLLRVEPVTSPRGRPVVDVTDFPTLARLAERYGLLVMHWTRSNVETYIVHDDGITYRYRTEADLTQTPPRPGTPQPADETVRDTGMTPRTTQQAGVLNSATPIDRD